jgi:oxygen-independent coproporphyrinogen-3 oxidase
MFQVYVHVPFCERKCHYCDFASWESPGVTQRRWLDTVLREIESAGRGAEKQKVRTVFFGGGTPSVVPASYLEAILDQLGGVYDLAGVEETTLEANPSSLTRDKVAAWRELGFNRVSLGVQSFDAEELKLLGRVHSPEGARQALEILAGASDFRFSGDLIFGLPGQTPERFLSNLESLLVFDPGHISFYGLTVEQGTVFERWQSEGRLKLPEGEQYRDLYRQGADLLKSRGLQRYEISNFAKPGQECRHNQGYWRGVPYRSFGPGAHSYDGRRRWMNPT